MGIVKIFYKDNCPQCPMAKNLKDDLIGRNIGVHYYNVETAEGLAEATFYRVMALPTIFVEDEMENGLGEWRGTSPEWKRFYVQCKEYSFPVKGFIETSFIDWKGHLASVMFSGGCNFRCPYCHNSSLVLKPHETANIPLKGIIGSLKRFKNWVDHVVITGGEATIHEGLAGTLETLKGEGMHIKLDTNGSRPGVLRTLTEKGLIDFIAMDVKGPLDRYARWSGVDVERGKIEESIQFILGSHVDYEFRMTVVPFLHREEDVYEVAQTVHRAKRFTVQTFKPNYTLDPSFSHIRPFSPDKMKKIRSNVRELLDTGSQWSAG